MFRLDAADHSVRQLGLQTIHYSTKTTYAPVTLGSCHQVRTRLPAVHWSYVQ